MEIIEWERQQRRAGKWVKADMKDFNIFAEWRQASGNFSVFSLPLAGNIIFGAQSNEHTTHTAWKNFPPVNGCWFFKNNHLCFHKMFPPSSCFLYAQKKKRELSSGPTRAGWNGAWQIYIVMCDISSSCMCSRRTRRMVKIYFHASLCKILFPSLSLCCPLQQLPSAWTKSNKNSRKTRMFQVKEDEMLLSGLAGISPLSLSFCVSFFLYLKNFWARVAEKKKKRKSTDDNDGSEHSPTFPWLVIVFVLAASAGERERVLPGGG